MRRRASTRAAAVACVGLLFLLVVTSAAAGFKSGRYVGTTSQGAEISFKATKLGVKKFDYRVDIECDDGKTWEFVSGESAKAPITEKGRFTAEFVTVDESITSVVSGKLKRRKGSGTVATEGTLPGGSECASNVDWRAVRQ
jgi:hypothetical protein